MFHFFRCLLGLASFFLCTSTAFAQGTAGYGDWQLHLPTNSPFRLADTGDRVYVAAGNTLYFLDKQLHTTQVLSRRDGLSDVGVAALAYDSVTRQTVIAYRNTNIDIIRPNGIVRNLNDVLRKTIQGNKNINQVSIGGNKAYMSTDFGVVVIDLLKLEISDTYSNIGPNGAVVSVYDAAMVGGYLYVATSAGLFRGLLTANLSDYNNWKSISPVSASRKARAKSRKILWAATNGMRQRLRCWPMARAGPAGQGKRPKGSLAHW